MNRRGIATIALVLSITLAAGLASACGDDDNGDNGDNGIEGAATTVASAVTGAGTEVADGDGAGGSAPVVNVALQEFEVSPQPDSVAAGTVTFRATNNGPEDEHEMVVIKTDLAASDLPTKDDGSVDEDGDGIDVIDEIEEFPVGETQELEVDLDAGSYVLVCNVVEEEDGQTESHYQEGMRTAFTVQ
jgi:uncharacterized cupredoxin-like copper-binding protein